jgi:hypothetical protein
MQITRVSMLSGIKRTIEIDVTQEQLTAWQEGMLIQNAMPHLTSDEREFVMTGVTAEEWEAGFGEEEV